MPSELQNLDTIFNSRVFRIPDYQRGFAWGASQLEDFWEDLDGLSNDRNHYTGQLTLESVPNSAWKLWDEDTWLIEGKGYKPFYVVDGQQRLTTAIILIKCLLDGIRMGGQVAFTDRSDHEKKYLVQTGPISRAYLLGYEKDNPSYEFFKTQVLAQPSNQYQGTETSYTANLLFAREYFRAKLKGASTQDTERWFRGITQRFRFNVYEVEGELDVFVVFETMNNRGKPLSRLELLKNRLIYLSTLAPPPADDAERQALRRNVNDSWKTAYAYLGRDKNHVLDDDDFLRAHWIMYFTFARETVGQFAEILLDRHFTRQRVVSGKVALEDLQLYVSSVQDSIRKWHAIHFPLDSTELSDEIRGSIERLGRLGRGAFAPLLMAALQRHQSGSDILELLAAAERFIFGVSRLCRRRADVGDSEFYRLAGKVYRSEATVSDATQSIEGYTNSYFSPELAIAEMRDLFQRASGFYSWDGLRYLLFEYEQHLKSLAGMSSSKVSWQELNSSKRDHVSIEHIYPMSPVSGDWTSFDSLSDSQRGQLRNSLGNLLALSQSRNSRFSNRPFSAKKQDAVDVRGYYNGSYSEITVAQEPDWSPESIRCRGLEMLDFTERRWNLSLGSTSEKLKLLGLDFMSA